MNTLSKVVVAASSLAALLALAPAKGADKWNPYKFSGKERYEYKVQSLQEGRLVDSGYALEVKPSDRKDADGQAQLEVSVTTRSYITKEQLENDAMGGLWGMNAMGAWAFLLNPMYGVVFQQVDLAVGEKMSFFGAGVVKVTAKETVGGREGFVCQFLQEEDGKQVLAAEYVIDPALALPLRSKMMQDGELQSSMELTSYSGK